MYASVGLRVRRDDTDGSGGVAKSKCQTFFVCSLLNSRCDAFFCLILSDQMRTRATKPFYVFHHLPSVGDSLWRVGDDE